MNIKTLEKLRNISYNNIDKSQGRQKHFSFLLLRNKILAYCRNNKQKTDAYHSRLGFKYGFPHSEVTLIKQCNEFDFNKLSLVNVRVDNNGDLLYSKPCKKCLKIISGYSFKDIFYSIDGGFSKLGV